MEITARRKVTMVVSASLIALTLAAGSAFAGRGVGGDNGNKYGNDNKKATVECTADYSLWSDEWGNPADLNNNGYVCAKWTGQADEYSFVDDISTRY